MRLLSLLLRNHVPANLTFLLVLVLGLLAYQSMPRAKDPEINFNWINIMTALPGASAADVEKRITDPIEDAISRAVKDVRFVSSTSREGFSSILVRFQQLDEKDFDKRLADLRREVQNVYTDELPEEAQDPLIYEVTTSSGFPTATVVLTAAAFDESLRRYGVFVKKALERLPGIDQALMEGAEQPELHIAFYPDRLVGLGITPADLADTVRSYFRDVSIGDIETQKGKWVIRLQGTSGSPEDLESFPVMSAEGVVELGSLADIYRTSEEPARYVRYLGKPAIVYNVTKQEAANTLELMAQLQTFIDERNRATDAQGMELVLVDDQTVSTREALSMMQTNALIGLLLVVLVAWLFLGTRIALLTGIGIPFTLAGTFLVLQTMGMSLNNSVLLGVVIALGMLVDDAVVVVESIYYRLQRGMQAVEASLEALREVFAPVTTSVMTTMAAFLPLMLLPGILGDFMRIIPLTVAVALAISLLEAFWMLPVHVSALKVDFTRKSRIQRKRESLTRRLRTRYSRLLLVALRYPYRALGIVLGIFALVLVLVFSGAVRVNFFATDAYRLFYVNVEMPSSTTLTATLDEVLEVERETIAHIFPEELRSTVSYAGQMLTQTEPLYGDNIGQVMVSLQPQAPDGRHVGEIMAELKTMMVGKTRPSGATVTLLAVEEGPPLGRSINVKVRGDDFAVLQAAVQELIGFMQTQDGLYDNITQDFRQGNRELMLSLNGDAIKRAGLQPDTVTRTLQAYVDGELVNQFQDNGEEVSVRVITREDASGAVEALLRQAVARPDGQSVALGDLVHVSYGFGQQNIRHYNFRRTITIEADIDNARIDTVKANALLRDYWLRVAPQYPQVDLDFSGELDDIQEGLDAIAMLFVMGIGLIYLILGTQFASYWQPLLVLVSVPLAFAGVVLGLVITGNPMSLYTLYGVVALSGISVNAAIVLIVAANDRIAQGMSVLHATIYAARRRVIPILITSFTTIAGLFSLAAGLGGTSLVWGPVATTIVSGLITSTVLTLFVVPLLYRSAMNRRSGHDKPL